MHQILGDNIQKLRKESGLTQEKLAALLGVSFQAVSRWENGVAYPDIELIPRLAFVFGISIDSLLGYQTEKINTTHYEKKYQDKDLYWGNEIWDKCYEVMKFLPPTRPLRLLDIGCGEGQTAIFFARNGYLVSAFDIAKSGIDKGKKFAGQCGVNVDFFEADMMEYRLEQNFDIIYASGLLQYIPVKERGHIIDNWKTHTNENGIHLLNVFVEKPFIDNPPDWEEKEYFWKSGELLTYYHDWKIELVEEIIFDCDSSGILHQHCMNVMIARKKSEIKAAGKRHNEMGI